MEPLYKTDDLAAYPENTHEGDDRRSDDRMRPERDPAHRRRRVGQLGERTDDLVELGGVDDLAAGNARQLLEHLRPGRSARPLGRRALDVERRLEGRAGLLAEERHLV